MQRQLSQPDFSVTSNAFMPLLVQADEAIAQLSKSAHFADSSAYLHRFRQVQNTRTLPRLLILHIDSMMIFFLSIVFTLTYLYINLLLSILGD